MITSSVASRAVALEDSDPGEPTGIRPQALMFAFLGEYAYPHPICVYAGSVIDVFGRAGVSEHATRSTLTRMVNRGLLLRQRAGRRMYYGVTPRTTDLLRDGRDRVFKVGAVNDRWDRSWTLLAFSLPDAWQRQRHDLRSQLSWAGFGPLQGGLWIAPGSPDVRAISAGLGLDAHVRVFRARADELTSVEQLIRDAYDIDGLAGRYRAFIKRWQPVLDGTPSADPLAAQLRLIVDWLQIVRRDPHLPVQHLPGDWPALPAQAVFMALQRRLNGPAARIAKRVLDTIPTLVDPDSDARP
jgi:phenylacetic acid degradation operon negative regulatory protein